MCGNRLQFYLGHLGMAYTKETGYFPEKRGMILIRRETWRLDYVTATKSQSAEICSTMRM